MQKKISLELIAKLNLTSSEQSTLSKEDQFNKLLEIETVHLEWQDLKQIEELELCSNIRSLYLQYNSIPKIENLEFLTKLEYLTLEGNLITEIEGLSTLFNLLYLNLANNKIEVLNLKTIPKEISILKLGGNPCTEDESYRKEVIEYFEFLDELDNISVVRERFIFKGLEFPAFQDDERPLTGRTEDSLETKDTLELNHIENFRFLNEDEDLQYAGITEATWSAVQKSKERLDELMVLRMEFHQKINQSRRRNGRGNDGTD